MINKNQEKEEYTNAKCEDFLENINDGVISTDHEGKIIFANYSAEKMLGWKAEEIMGTKINEICVAFDERGNQIPKKKCPLAFVLENKKPVQDASFFYKRKDGTIFPVSFSITPILSGGELMGLIDIFQDITREKDMEKLRIDFLVLASHQLRTPLSGIKWMIETMLRGVTGEINEKQKDYLNRMYNVNERMIKIVFEMFSVLNLESGSFLINKSTISVEKICEDATMLMMPSAKENGVLLENTSKVNDVIETDLKIVSMIINYLLSNAIDYSFVDGRVILNAVVENNDIIFSIKDNGIGIPKEEQGMVFDRFYRGSNARSFKPNGTGLGLSVAKTLAEKIGGTITFQSEENKGSTFYLRIPKKSSNIKV